MFARQGYLRPEPMLGANHESSDPSVWFDSEAKRHVCICPKCKLKGVPRNGMFNCEICRARFDNLRCAYCEQSIEEFQNHVVQCQQRYASNVGGSLNNNISVSDQKLSISDFENYSESEASDWSDCEEIDFTEGIPVPVKNTLADVNKVVNEIVKEQSNASTSKPQSTSSTPVKPQKEILTAREARKQKQCGVVSPPKSKTVSPKSVFQIRSEMKSDQINKCPETVTENSVDSESSQPSFYSISSKRKRGSDDYIANCLPTPKRTAKVKAQFAISHAICDESSSEDEIKPAARGGITRQLSKTVNSQKLTSTNTPELRIEKVNFKVVIKQKKGEVNRKPSVPSPDSKSNATSSEIAEKETNKPSEVDLTCQEDLSENDYNSEDDFDYKELESQKAGMYSCKKCPKTFRNLYSLAKHLRSHSLMTDRSSESTERPEDPNITIDIVSPTKDTPQIPAGDPELHETPVSNSGKKDENVIIVESSPEFICGVCSVKFETEKSLESHMQQHTNYSPSASKYKCGSCEDMFMDYQALAAHARNHCRGRNQENEEKVDKHEEEFVCGVCKCSFSNLEDMSAHLPTHMNQNSCSKCDRNFETELILTEHLKTVHLTCSTCEKSFASKMLLENHLRMHNKKPNEGKARVVEKMPADSCQLDIVKDKSTENSGSDKRDDCELIKLKESVDKKFKGAAHAAQKIPDGKIVILGGKETLSKLGKKETLSKLLKYKPKFF